MKNYNSSENQKIKRDFTNREIFANLGTMVNYILIQDDYHNAPFCYDDIENLYINNNEEIEELEKMLLIEALTDEEVEEIESTIQDLQDEQVEPRGWYEAYKVSGWLAKKLEAKGELVILHENIWLRQTTGQHILLDEIISEICNDIGLLK